MYLGHNIIQIFLMKYFFCDFYFDVMKNKLKVIIGINPLYRMY